MAPVVTMEPFPSECSRCPRENRQRFGCGHDERTAGLADIEFLWASKFTGARVKRTCPRYYAETDRDACELLWGLEDYTRGALGPVGALPAPLVTYYRIAEIERQKWRDKQTEG